MGAANSRFALERLDRCRNRGVEVDLETWWRDGLLLTPRAIAESALDDIPAEQTHSGVS